MATIKEVSQRAGVSSATVSHVINNTRYVSDAVRERVMAAIEELNYKPNYIARTLRKGKSDTIGVIIPNTRNSYFTEIAWCIEQVASKDNYSIIICNSENTPEKEVFYINILMQKQVDGIAFFSSINNEEASNLLLSSNIPFVIVDKEFEKKTDNSVVVMTDEQQGAECAIEYLTSLGHKKIACITGGDSDQITSEKRKTGYYEAMKRHKLPVNDEYVAEGDFSLNSGYLAGLKLLKLEDRPTAIFIFNDLMAMGVLRAAHECNVRVPEDVSLIGFDNIEMTSYSIPPLTTIAQNKSKLAENIVSSLLAMNKKEEITSRRIIIPTDFIERKSCIKLNS